MDKFYRMLPQIPFGAGEMATGVIIFFLWAFIALFIAGYLKRYAGFRTGYTRKIFHFLIFFAASFIQWRWGFFAVCLFGAMTSIIIFYALLKGDGHLLYEAIAREEDSPHRTMYIIMPYLATLIGGLITNLFFSQFAIVGYLVTGIGDAIAEPVGVRFGKHTYRTRAMGRVSSVRTLEGSLAVFTGSWISLLVGFMMLSIFDPSPGQFALLTGVSLVCVLVEAVSPHGWDNTMLQVVPTFLVSLAVG